jgi:nucleoside-diphosphate-sugar epimerase
MNLLLGSESFVAKNLECDIKISRDHCDLTNYDQLISVLKHFKPTTVINCAAAHGSAKLMSQNHSHFLEHNVIMDSNVLKASHSLDIENVVLLSSVSAFPNIENRDLVEGDLYKGDVNNYNQGYNTSKRVAHDLCKSYQLDYSRNYKVLFLGNLYGKYGKFAKDANVLNSIIYQMHQAKINRADLTLYGDGLDSRAFTFVEDLNKIMAPFTGNDSINSAIFSSNEVVTIRQLADLIAIKMEFNGEIIFTGEPTIGQRRKVASSDYLQNEIKGLSFTRLEVGLEIVVNWFIDSLATPN